MWQLGFEQVVMTIPRRLIDTCRYVDFSLESDAEFYPCLKRLCASSRYRNRHAIPNINEAGPLPSRSQARELNARREGIR